jgi:cytosine/adenosine deaminase-related metal-dependent hydrolase
MSRMIVRARTIVTMNSAPIENGAVAIAGEKISDVGNFADVAGRNTGEIVDLGEQILLPGLINVHCHLDYTCLRGKIAPPKSFADWIGAINAKKATLSPEDYVDSIERGFEEAQRFGTTTIGNLTAFPELVARITPPIRTWWFAELIDIREPGNANAIVERAVEHFQGVQNWGLAPHAPYTASPQLYARCEAVTDLLTTHLAESEDETAMSAGREGPLFELLKSLRLPLFQQNRMTPVQHLLANCNLDHRWILVHLNSVLDSDLAMLAKWDTKCHVVHCPRSHAYFRHPTFQFSKFRESGFNICLATDSLASNDDLNLFEEMRKFQSSQSELSPEQILHFVTRNPAQALGAARQVGQLARGFFADLIAIPAGSSKSDVFEKILAHEGPVSWMMIDGKVRAPSTA